MPFHKEKDTAMKIVKILGGLGNQMFQYAFYLALKAKYPSEDIRIDLHCFKGYNLHNGFELAKIFNLAYTTSTLTDSFKLAYPYWNYSAWRLLSRILPLRKSMIVGGTLNSYKQQVFCRKESCYYDGYWQNEQYFKEIREHVLKAFTFPSFDIENAKYAQQIVATNSVSIHIRRGDYLSNPIYENICTIDYYRKATQEIEKRTDIELFCIFSNDIEWCKKSLNNYLGDKQTIYINCNRGLYSYNDMHLMSLCKHNIIANSSFSWWGAWLNQNHEKIVVAPSAWVNIKGFTSPVCTDWITI